MLPKRQDSRRAIGQCRVIPSPRIISTPVLNILISQLSDSYMISIATATVQRRIDRVISNLQYQFTISRVSVLCSAPALIWSCGLIERLTALAPLECKVRFTFCTYHQSPSTRSRVGGERAGMHVHTTNLLDCTGEQATIRQQTVANTRELSTISPNSDG